MRTVKKYYENELTFMEMAYSTSYNIGYIDEDGSWLDVDGYCEYRETSWIHMTRQFNERAASLKV